MQSRTRSSNGPIHVESSGSGPPIVLTHGYGDSSSTWDAQVAFLEPRFTTLRWDLLGHGRSACPTDSTAYSREQALAHLDSVIEQADGAAVLVGHSLGGYLSQCRALLDRSGIRALVLVASGPGFRDPESRARWNRGASRAAERFGLAAESAGLLTQSDAMVMDQLDRLTLPVLLIAGERDAVFCGATRYLARRLPSATCLVVPEAGHMLHQKQAAQVNAALGSFLESL